MEGEISGRIARNHPEKTKKEFKEQAEKEMPEWNNRKKADETAEYILSNRKAAKLRLKGTEQDVKEKQSTL